MDENTHGYSQEEWNSFTEEYKQKIIDSENQSVPAEGEGGK